MALLCLAALLPATPQAATWHVDALEGNDSASGQAPEAAWRSLHRLEQQSLSPGDSVLLRRGSVWREELELTTSGLPGAPVVYEAYGTGPAPTIHGADPVQDWTRLDSARCTAPLASLPEQVFFGEVRGQKVASAADATTAHTWHWDSGTLTIHSTEAPAGIEATTRPFGIKANGKTSIVLRGLAVIRAYHALFLHNTSFITAERLHLDENAGYGAICITADTAGAGAGHHLLDCEVSHTTGSHASKLDDNNGTGIFVFSEAGYTNHNLISGNHVHHNGHEGIVLLNSSSNVVHGNQVYGNSESGIRVGRELSTGNLIEGNQVYGNCLEVDDRYGIDLIRVGNGNHVRYNMVHNQHRIDAGLYGSGGIRFDGGDWEGHDHMASTGNRAYYNVVYEEYIGIASFNFSNIEIYNNTVVNTTHCGIALHSNSTVTPANDIARNNVVATTEGIIVFHRDVDQPVLDHNAYLPFSQVNFVWDGGYMDFGSWQAASGQDAHSHYADPGLRDRLSHDFRLREDSLCRDTGEDAELTMDIAGTAVPQNGAPDIGAYEYVVNSGEGEGEGEAPAITMARTLLQAEYTPGAALDIQISLAYEQASEPLTALSVTEVLPAGWTFDCVVTGDQPDVPPASGAENAVSFAWVTIPTFPVTFTYRVRVPETAGGTQQVTGQAACQTSAGELYSDEVVTAIEPATGGAAEGEGEGEGEGAVVAAFEAEPTMGPLPLQVAFTDTSHASVPLDVWEWDFGDGCTSYEQNPVHLYDTPGTYCVELRVYAGIETDSVTHTNAITVHESLPTATRCFLVLLGLVLGTAAAGAVAAKGRVGE